MSSRPRLVLALVPCLVVAGVAGAASDHRDAPAETEPPVVVYVSETLDVSAVGLTGGGTVGTDETTFDSIDGDRTFTVDPERADLDGIEPGAYDARSDADDRPELTVVEPRVTDLELRNERNVDVTDRTVARGDLDEVTVTAAYDFDEADRLDVTVESPDGLDLAGDARITTSGGSVTVETGNQPAGVYEVTVEGSGIDDGRATATVTVEGPATATATATPEPTPTPTPTATPEPTPTATPSVTTTDTPTPIPTPTPTPTPTPASTPTATEGRGPGPGVIGVVTALVAAAWWRRSLVR
jgi:hypothetical protein